MPLQKELETYKREFYNLAKDDGKYVLIHESKVVDTFMSYDDALKAGYQQFGLEPFLVKQIQAVEHAQFITRLVDTPCHI